MSSGKQETAPDQGSNGIDAKHRYLRDGSGPVSNANAANLITLFRILLAPIVVLLLVWDDQDMGVLRFVSAAFFILGMATDSVDGNLARSRNLVTNFGKILDPIADKALIGSALITLSVFGEISWWITVPILVREMGITLYRFWVIRDRVIAASGGGKLKTVIQTIAISFTLVPLFTWLGDWMLWVNLVWLLFALVLTLSSGVQYLAAAFRATPSSPEQSDSVSKGQQNPSTGA